jgi:dihydrofolate reductase
MRELVVQTFLTVDGVMQAPGGPEEDPTSGFAHGGWSVNYWDGAMEETVGKAMTPPIDLLLGRKTYEIFAAHWPYTDEPGADVLNNATKHVASRTLETLEWSNSRLLEDEVAVAVPRLKAEEGPELQVHGSADLIQTLLAHDLIDEFRLWIFPVVVGPGKRLFGDRTQAGALELVNSKTSSTGVVMTTYRRAGAIEEGSFALEEPTEAEIKRRQSIKGS